MYCKDCKFRRQKDSNYLLPECTSGKIVEDGYYIKFNPTGDRLVYSYSEGGTFYVEDNFGCVHFEPAELATWKDLINQAKSFQKRVSAIEARLQNIRSGCKHLNLPARQIGEEYMDVCPDCGFVSYCYSI